MACCPPIPPTLTSLPLDVLCGMVAYLPRSGIGALRCTCRRMVRATECRQAAIHQEPPSYPEISSLGRVVQCRKPGGRVTYYDPDTASILVWDVYIGPTFLSTTVYGLGVHTNLRQLAESKQGYRKSMARLRQWYHTHPHTVACPDIILDALLRRQSRASGELYPYRTLLSIADRLAAPLIETPLSVLVRDLYIRVRAARGSVLDLPDHGITDAAPYTCTSRLEADRRAFFDRHVRIVLLAWWATGTGFLLRYTPEAYVYATFYGGWLRSNTTLAHVNRLVATLLGLVWDHADRLFDLPSPSTVLGKECGV
jgi:hypothetical protein